MTFQNRELKVFPIEDGFEETFWKHVDRDPFNYYFFILDLKLRREHTKIFLAVKGKRVEGLALLYADWIVQLRGNRKAVEKLLEHVNLEKVELQAPLNCEDLVTRRYKPNVRYELVLMKLDKGEERLQVRHEPVRLVPEDAPRVAEIMRTADPEWWGDIKTEDRKESLEKTYWLGIKQDGRIVSIGNTRFENIGSNIGVIATDEQYRNRGYATSIVSVLVREILKHSPTALIHVLKHNIPAVKVYSRVGYKHYKEYMLIRGEKIRD